ncbi:hypothetical protein, partial [Sinorhizobium meliloti]|uniref:hypothetical protein n=1 Tax=Rhizobium meliloti TaxID=382 RepID=UPI001AECD946
QQKRGSPSPTSACSPDALQDMDIVETFSSPTLKSEPIIWHLQLGNIDSAAGGGWRIEARAVL